jgi:aminoglycoside/choline kinase family phosphotransferase
VKNYFTLRTITWEATSCCHFILSCYELINGRGFRFKVQDIMLINEARHHALRKWVQNYIPSEEIIPIPGDASFRRYFRVFCLDCNYIAVDSPPHTENNIAFVAIAKAFFKRGLLVPEVLQVDFNQGFLLLSDLGDQQLLPALHENTVDQYYSSAMQEIIKLQPCRSFDGWQLPLFTKSLLLEELSRFQEWYLTHYLRLELSANERSMLNGIYTKLIHSATLQPKVCVHRDFHSRNLMLMTGNRMGILDFQDAVKGPVTYDLVSLLKDCYINWPVEKIQGWVKDFHACLKPACVLNLPSLDQFMQWFDWMGLQRHLKVLGTFARLLKRDGKSNYVKDMPRVLKYIQIVLDQYPELASLKAFMKERVLDESNDFSSGSRQSHEATY